MKENILDDLIKTLMIGNPDDTDFVERFQDQILQSLILSQPPFYTYSPAHDFFS